jgi:hypothetical protein
MITRLLKQQSLEILEVLETVTDNISHQRADLLACIPKLRNIMCELMEDHRSNVQLLATKLGKSHTLVRKMVEQHLQLEEAVNRTLRQINEAVMDSKEDWKEYRNASTDHDVPSEKNLFLGPHAPQGPLAPLGPHAPDSRVFSSTPVCSCPGCTMHFSYQDRT